MLLRPDDLIADEIEFFASLVCLLMDLGCQSYTFSKMITVFQSVLLREKP